MDNCAFLVRGMCPNHARNCDKPCDKYSILGDDSKEIFHDWNNGINKLATELRQKYFGVTEKSAEAPNKVKHKDIETEDNEIDDINDFLGE
jgi:hypothetical protein